MMSTIQDPACRTCGMEMRVSVSTWSMQWLRALQSRIGFELDTSKDTAITNFAQLGEQLLAPHGEKLGLVYLPILEPGEEATCACERPVAVVIPDPSLVPAAGNSRNREGDVVDNEMDTGEVVDLLKGAIKLVPQFSKLCSLSNLCALKPEGYPQELLSSRLQGDEIKEALAITIMLRRQEDKPGEPPLRWMPKELLSATDIVLRERKSFLTSKALIPTVREKKAGAAMEMFKGTEVRPQLKRKLELDNDEVVPVQRQPKRVKLFTTTPAEMVKIFAQFAQAQADGGHRRINPVRTMETLVDRIMDSRPQQPQHPPEVVNLDADTVGEVPAVQAAGNPDGLQPAAVQAVQPVQAVGALGASHNAAAATLGGGGGRGGGRGRGRAAHRGANSNLSNQVVVQGDMPIRCSHLTSTGAHCRTENFPEAMQCRGCNGRLQGQSLPPPQRGGGRGSQGGRWQGRSRRSRGRGFNN